MKKLIVFDVLFVLLMVGGIAFEEEIKPGFFDAANKKLTQTSDSFFGIFESKAQGISDKSEEKTQEGSFQPSEKNEILQVTIFESMELQAPELFHSKDGKIAFFIHGNTGSSSLKSTFDSSGFEMDQKVLLNQLNFEPREGNPQEVYNENDFLIQVKCEIQKLQEVIRRSNS